MKKPLVFVVMDGVGFGKDPEGDAVKQANTPTLDWLLANCPNTQIKAHGTAVGLPSDADMGNSEVGHNALGCGQIYSQGAKLVNDSIESGSMFNSGTWKEMAANCVEHKSTMHFIGLLSDGNVHSNISHLKAMIAEAKKDGVSKVRVHILLDGRDVPATSALQYVDELEDFLTEQRDADFDCRIASGGGRMVITMDRYQANWNMVKEGWETHVHGVGRQFPTAKEAIETYRKEFEVIDQVLPAFVIAENGQPVGTIEDNDSVIFYNFRGDRAIEISMAFEYEDFDKFDRGRNPKVLYAGMLQYDGDLKLPKKFLVAPPDIKNTLSQLLVANGIKQYAVSETQKYGHVTYFWNGNKSGKTSEELEVFYEVRCNYPNGDMVGHTGSLVATRIGVESVDLGLARIIKEMETHDFTLIVTADHGNADDMIERNKKTGAISPKTAHSLNPVPFIIYDKDTRYEIKDGHFGLANCAATVAILTDIYRKTRQFLPCFSFFIHVYYWNFTSL